MRISWLENNPRLWIGGLFLWMIVIFVLSTSFFSSERTDTFPGLFGIRFLAHLFVYAVLGFLAVGAADHHFRWKRTIFWVFLFCILYAVTDEIHQHLEPGRYGRLQDVLLDGGGAALGIFVHRVIFRGWIRKKSL